MPDVPSVWNILTMQFFSCVLHMIKVVVHTCVTQATVTQIALINSRNAIRYSNVRIFDLKKSTISHNFQIIDAYCDSGTWDLLSTLRSAFGEDHAEDITRVLSTEGGGVGLTLFFHVLVNPSGHSLRRSSLSGGSPARAEVTVRRRSTARLIGEIYDGESIDDDNESSDGVESGLGLHISN
nr:hypothetical protein [Tanacetum cinerariifolium]